MSTTNRTFVKLHTTMGDVIIELDTVATPKTAANFLQYVREGHYDGTIFHRVINGFVIQGGGLTADMAEKPTRAPIENESKTAIPNSPWTVAMARNADPNSATSQFYINLATNYHLNARGDSLGYTVFGVVIEGQGVVRDIAAVETRDMQGTGDMPVMHEDVPVEPIVITKAEVVEDPLQ